MLAVPIAISTTSIRAQVEMPGSRLLAPDPQGYFTIDFVTCIVTLYILIKSFRHRGLEKFFRTGSKAGIQPKHAAKLRLQLFALDNAKRPGDMNAPGWKLHPLAGELKDHWAVWLSRNWRLTFRFEGEDAVPANYQDYHQE